MYRLSTAPKDGVESGSVRVESRASAPIVCNHPACGQFFTTVKALHAHQSDHDSRARLLVSAPNIDQVQSLALSLLSSYTPHWRPAFSCHLVQLLSVSLLSSVNRFSPFIHHDVFLLNRDWLHIGRLTTHGRVKCKSSAGTVWVIDSRVRYVSVDS